MEGRAFLDRNPNSVYRKGCYVLTRVNGQCPLVQDFELYLPSRPPDAVEEAEELSGNILVTFIGKSLQQTRHRARYSRRFESDYARFTILIPSPSFPGISPPSILYAVQGNHAEGKALIQWAMHHHDSRKEELLDAAEIALFAETGSFRLFAGLIGEQDIFMMGVAMPAILSTYREIEPEIRH